MPTYTYGEIEGALAKLYDAKNVQRETFRGRLKHFRKLGLPKEQPGKGAKIRYSLSDIYQLMIALEFAEFGIDPHLIADIVRRDWRLKLRLFQAVDLAGQYPDMDFHVIVEARCMSTTWNPRWSKETDTEISYGASSPLVIRFFKTSDIKALEDLWRHFGAGQRCFTFNLSARMRDVKRALAMEAEHGRSQATVV